MSNTTRDKFLSLVKQLTSIELGFVANDIAPTTGKIIKKLNDDESIVLKSFESTSYQRAQKRLQLTQAREQQNLENIFALAAEYVSSGINIDKLELDWLVRYTELACKVYSANLQELWAKILAVELTHIGSFSQRTLKLLAELSAKEAMLFQRAANLVCKIGNDKTDKLLTGIYKRPSIIDWFGSNPRLHFNLNKLGLNYAHILTLVELGMLQSQEIESATIKSKDSVSLSYLNDKVELQVGSKDIVFCYYKFTQAGNELLKLVSSKRNDMFFEQLNEDFYSVCKINRNPSVKA